MTLEEAQRLWQPETLYLNTASYGLPPTPAWEELQAVLADWRGGRTSWEGWGDSTEAARASFARLVGVPTEWIAIGANTSSMVGLVAASLPDDARVVSTEPEFTSLLWPFLAQRRGIEVECVPVARVADAVDERTDVVAVSVVQSSTGELADLDSVIEAAAAHDARVVVDATQAWHRSRPLPTASRGNPTRRNSSPMTRSWRMAPITRQLTRFARSSRRRGRCGGRHAVPLSSRSVRAGVAS